MKETGEQLPLFEGFQPAGASYKLTGTTEMSEDVPLDVDDLVFLLVRARVRGVNHERKGADGVLMREHKLKLIGAELVDPESEVADKIVSEAADYLASLDPGPASADDEGGE